MFKAAHLKIVVAVIVIISMVLLNILPAFASPFSDISNYWAKDSILRLASLQIVNGYNGSYNPSGDVTRAEFAAMMVKALGLTDQAQVMQGSDTGYTDVPASHWAAGFINVARERNIISGYPDGTFRPSAKIRRDEITSVLVRALDLTAAGNMTDITQVFDDGENIPNWALESVQIAYNYNLIRGFPDGMFHPASNATRGETAVLIEKVLDRLGAEFTLAGTLEGVDRNSQVLNLNVQGQEDYYAYSPDVEVRVDGETATLSDLTPGIGVKVILDEDGNIDFIQADTSESDVSGQPAQVKSVSALPGNAAPEPAESNREQNVSAMIVTSKGDTDRVSQYIRSSGGKVDYTSQGADFITASVSSSLFGKLKANPMVDEATIDQKVKVEALASEQSQVPESSEDSNPGASLNVTKEAIIAPEFVSATKADGKGQVIAIIDTGVDAGHLDLQKTSDGKPKIVDWQDFTNEGDVDTSSTVQPVGKYIRLVNGSYYLGSITSAGGTIKYGYLREADIVDAQEGNLDINFNGKVNDDFAVILVDSQNRGVYDTVYIDTNSNNDFSDEKPLHIFALDQAYASFTGNNGKDSFDVVLTAIANNGSKINLGFDGNDHGTHVAGIAAANGKIKGVAPGAQLMVLKALDSVGYGTLGNISRAMTYAAQHGAKIINLSLGLPVGDSDNSGLPVKLLDNLTERYGVIFIIAAGNDGPGLSTTSAPPDDRGIVTVGAFNSPQMWKTDYGWNVPSEDLWFFSSAGPRQDGGISPSIVAPGSVISTVPLRDGKQYWLSEGTSMAVPHVSGAVALLMEAAAGDGLNVTPEAINRALEMGARPIPGYQPAEQGYGALNLMMSWAKLLSVKDTSVIIAQTVNPYNVNGTGVFFKGETPGKVTVNLTNTSGQTRKLALNQDSWVEPGQPTITIPPGKTRAVDFNLNVPDKKGLFSAFITGTDPVTFDNPLHILTTVVNPYDLAEENSYSVSIKDSAEPAQYQRYFFRVPFGANTINAKLTVPNAAGRAMVFLYDPQGHLISQSGFAGTNPEGKTGEVTASGNLPAPGVWEAVVYSSAALSAYGLNNSTYTLNVMADGVVSSSLPQENRSLIIGIVPKPIIAGEKNYVTVQVRDRNTKRPFEGYVEIDGKLYFSRAGRVILPVATEGEDVKIVIRTVPDTPAVEPSEFDFILPFAG